MAHRVNFTVPADLARRIDKYAAEHGITNKSDAVRVLIDLGLGRSFDETAFARAKSNVIARVQKALAEALNAP